jgi:hypothetical protein
MIGRNSLALAGVAMAALAGAWPVRAQQIDYSGSVQYASGDYLFPERSSALFLYNGLGVTAGRMRFSASVPLVFQRTPWVIYTDVTGDSGADGGSTAGQDVAGSGGEVGYTAVDTISYEELGLGDPLVRADLRLLDDSGLWPSVRVTFDVKVPVGDVERGFSSGEWDYAGGVSVTKSVGTRIQPAVDPPVQVSLGLSYLLDLRRSLMISASAGLTDSAPDISLSFGWFIRF